MLWWQRGETVISLTVWWIKISARIGATVDPAATTADTAATTADTADNVVAPTAALAAASASASSS